MNQMRMFGGNYSFQLMGFYTMMQVVKSKHKQGVSWEPCRSLEYCSLVKNKKNVVLKVRSEKRSVRRYSKKSDYFSVTCILCGCGGR